MRPFEEAFAGFVTTCASLHDLFIPASIVMLVSSFGFFFWSAPQHPIELLKFITKLFLIVILITNAGDLINGSQRLIQIFVERHIPARPDRVAERYKEKLAMAQGNSELGNQGWWDMLFSANFFEALVYAALLLLSWLAMAILFYTYLLQKAVLLVCWVMSPMLFACFAIPLVSGLALRHILRIVGILLWPLGLALAATITDGLIDIQSDQSFLFNGSITGRFQYVLLNLLSVATIGIWILFSSVLAPVAMQRLVSGGAGSAAYLSRSAELLLFPGIPLVTGALSSVHQRISEWGPHLKSSITKPVFVPFDNENGFAVDPPTSERSVQMIPRRITLFERL